MSYSLLHMHYLMKPVSPAVQNLKQPIKQVNCLRLSTRQHELLMSEGVNQVCFRGETPRESDWGCQSIPWPLYTIILYVHVCTRSTNTV